MRGTPLGAMAKPGRLTDGSGPSKNNIRALQAAVAACPQ